MLMMLSFLVSFLMMQEMMMMVYSYNRPSWSFNGGKMKHIFSFNDKYKYSPVVSSREAEEALLHGNFYYKIDGSNGMIQVIPAASTANDDGSSHPTTIKAYRRLDTRGKEPPRTDGRMIIPLPPGENPSNYTSHTYYYDEITTTNVAGKKLLKLNHAMLELVQRHVDKFESLGKEWTSVEWVGRKFGGTPNVPYDVALAIHEEQKVIQEQGEQEEKNAIERTYNGIRKYLFEDCAEYPIEGLILEHKGNYWKVVCGAFPLLPFPDDEDSCSIEMQDPFRGNRENARPPRFLV